MLIILYHRYSSVFSIQILVCLQSRILELVAFPFSRGSSNAGIELGSPALQILYQLSSEGNPIQILMCQIFLIPVRLYSSPVTTYNHMLHPQYVSSISIFPNFLNFYACWNSFCLSVLHVLICDFGSVYLNYWLYFNHKGKLNLTKFTFISLLILMYYIFDFLKINHVFT